jgi:hypothetical protein
MRLIIFIIDFFIILCFIGAFYLAYKTGEEKRGGDKK